MPEEALLDAPADAVAEIDNAVDTSTVDSREAVDTGSESQPETDSSEAPLKGSALWREVKANEAIPPKLKSALNKVIHANDAFSTRYPDGLKQIDGAMAAVKQLLGDDSVPIEQGIEATVKELGYFRKLDVDFSEGKPEFVDELATVSPEAFEKLAPAVFRKYSEMNNDAYSTYIAGVAVGHMNQAEVPLQFKILQSFLPQLPDSPAKQNVIDAIEAIYGWTQGLKSMAARKIEQKALPSTQNGQNGQDPAARVAELEQQITAQGWNDSIRAQSNGFVRSEADKAAQTSHKTKLTDAEHQKVLDKTKEEYTARLQMDKRYKETVTGYVRAGNRLAYIQRVQSEQKKLIPGAVRRAVADVIEARPKAAPRAVNGQPKPESGKKPAGAPLAGAVQYRRIAGHPKTQGLQVDLTRTTQTMLLSNHAYVKGQPQPVEWPRAKI